jgi:hypothetical protein
MKQTKKEAVKAISERGAKAGRLFEQWDEIKLIELVAKYNRTFPTKATKKESPYKFSELCEDFFKVSAITKAQLGDDYEKKIKNKGNSLLGAIKAQTGTTLKLPVSQRDGTAVRTTPMEDLLGAAGIPIKALQKAG